MDWNGKIDTAANVLPSPENQGMTTILASRQKRVEAGLIAVQEVEAERDVLQEKFDDLLTGHRGLKAEHDALSLAYERAQNDITTWRQDRDEAVSKLAAFEAVFNAVLAVMQKHRGAIQEDSAAIPKG
jgi:chromosome segregation ATPase